MWTDYYAVDKGKLFEVREILTAYGDTRIECVGLPYCCEYGVRKNRYNLREEAQAAAEKRIKKRLASLRKQIDRIEKIDFNLPKDE